MTQAQNAGQWLPGTIWLTGLPAAGKTTLAHELAASVRDTGLEAVIIDGDDLRATRTQHLGFGRSDRRANLLTAVDLAVEAWAKGAVALVALVSPFADDRRAARERHSARGAPFVEVFVDTPLRVCERRDPKGLYRAARSGSLRNLTGVGAPYERPESPEVIVVPDDPPAYPAGSRGAQRLGARLRPSLRRRAEPARLPRSRRSPTPRRHGRLPTDRRPPTA